METLKIGSRRERTVMLLQSLLAEAGLPVSIDGRFGTGTWRAVQAFQRRHDLVVDGIVGEKTWLALTGSFPGFVERMTSRYLGECDIEKLASDLGVENAVIKAVNEVESLGSGFIIDKPKILFEGHVFWKQLKARGIDPDTVLTGNEDILYPGWTAAHYLGGLREYERLEKASGIHRDAALESASWGMFQIMGCHAQALGYGDVRNFAARMRRHEREHLKAFGALVRVNNLVRHLRRREWDKFARAYNGPGYRKNRYHIRLARAYERYRK